MEDLQKAMKMLKDKYDVIPKSYVEYRKNSYIFYAPPKNSNNDETYFGANYLVDIDDEIVGPFSIAYIIDKDPYLLNNMKLIK